MIDLVVETGLRACSPRGVLQRLADCAAVRLDREARDVLEALTARERLGTTALGHGVAVPSARLPGLARATAVLLRLETPVAFDAPDGRPVDLALGIFAGVEADGPQCRDLAGLLRRLRDPEIVDRLRDALDAGLDATPFLGLARDGAAADGEIASGP